MTEALKYFRPQELWDRENRVVKLAPPSYNYVGFGKRIDLLRERWGKRLIVTSCCRSADRNARIGGHPRSLHVYDKPYHDTGGTCAIDIAQTSEEFRAFAWDMGFSVGTYKSWSHLDDRFPLLGMPQTRFVGG